jgi:hypothetical protein
MSKYVPVSWYRLQIHIAQNITTRGGITSVIVPKLFASLAQIRGNARRMHCIYRK